MREDIPIWQRKLLLTVSRNKTLWLPGSNLDMLYVAISLGLQRALVKLGDEGSHKCRDFC